MASQTARPPSGSSHREALFDAPLLHRDCSGNSLPGHTSSAASHGVRTSNLRLPVVNRPPAPIQPAAATRAVVKCCQAGPPGRGVPGSGDRPTRSLQPWLNKAYRLFLSDGPWRRGGPGSREWPTRVAERKSDRGPFRGPGGSGLVGRGVLYLWPADSGWPGVRGTWPAHWSGRRILSRMWCGIMMAARRLSGPSRL